MRIHRLLGVGLMVVWFWGLTGPNKFSSDEHAQNSFVRAEIQIPPEAPKQLKFSDGKLLWPGNGKVTLLGPPISLDKERDSWLFFLTIQVKGESRYYEAWVIGDKVVAFTTPGY